MSQILHRPWEHRSKAPPLTWFCTASLLLQPMIVGCFETSLEKEIWWKQWFCLLIWLGHYLCSNLGTFHHLNFVAQRHLNFVFGKKPTCRWSEEALFLQWTLFSLCYFLVSFTVIFPLFRDSQHLALSITIMFSKSTFHDWRGCCWIPHRPAW